jgi:hypothetical protein
MRPAVLPPPVGADLVPAEGAQPGKQSGLPTVGPELGDHLGEGYLGNLFSRIGTVVEPGQGKAIEPRKIAVEELFKGLFITG